MADIFITFECPKCRCAAKVEIKSNYKFILCTCPKCKSNVVFYDNKIDIVSDKIIYKLWAKKKLRLYGYRTPVKKLEKKSSNRQITGDAITNLKILMETETNFDSFLAKL